MLRDTGEIDMRGGVGKTVIAFWSVIEDEIKTSKEEHRYYG